MVHRRIRKPVGQRKPLRLRKPIRALRSRKELTLNNCGMTAHQRVTPPAPPRLLLRIRQAHPPILVYFDRLRNRPYAPSPLPRSSPRPAGIDSQNFEKFRRSKSIQNQ
jgi:hypothetical protein